MNRKIPHNAVANALFACHRQISLTVPNFIMATNSFSVLQDSQSRARKIAEHALDAHIINSGLPMKVCEQCGVSNITVEFTINEQIKTDAPDPKSLPVSTKCTVCSFVYSLDDFFHSRSL